MIPQTFKHPLPPIPEELKQYISEEELEALHHGSGYIYPDGYADRDYRLYSIVRKKHPAWKLMREWSDEMKREVVKKKSGWFWERSVERDFYAIEEMNPHRQETLRLELIMEAWSRKADAITEFCWDKFKESLTVEEYIKMLYT